MNTPAIPMAVLIAAPDLLAAAEAALAYHDAIAACGNDPTRMASYCTAAGEDLDVLYERWVFTARAAVARATGGTA